MLRCQKRQQTAPFRQHVRKVDFEHDTVVQSLGKANGSEIKAGTNQNKLPKRWGRGSEGWRLKMFPGTH